ncbi:MAG: F0F1 ATP synthase subunit epsilon [Clostridia bacterium]|nr:F0F1 ATP synthase subunit epsilon [Clostridia bacterium]
MKAFPLKISSPDGDIFSGEVEMLSLRTTEGELAILAGHIPFVSSVVACKCKLLLPDETEIVAYTDGGVLTVSSDKTVLLTGSWEREEK